MVWAHSVLPLNTEEWLVREESLRGLTNGHAGRHVFHVAPASAVLLFFSAVLS